MSLPTFFINHGSGPGPLLGLKSQAPVADHLRAIGARLPPCKCLVVVSAHWVEPFVNVTSAESLPLVYDYDGYPKDAYNFQYAAKGHPAVAKRVFQLLKGQGIPSKLNPQRGLDHGAFVPLMLMAPDAVLPVVCVSLVTGLDAQTHWRIGRALAPLRAEGVLLVGSGQSYSPQARGPKDGESSAVWDQALAAVCGDAAGRRGRLVGWGGLPFARAAHPTGDHLMPLMVAAGAVDPDQSPAHRIFEAVVDDVHLSSYQFGPLPDAAPDPQPVGEG